MNALVQSSIVFLIVAIASGYAVLKFMPARARRALAARAARIAAQAGLSDATARRVEAKLSTGGACGSCDSCKACATPTVEAALTDNAAPSTGAHRRIPIRPVR